MCEKGSSLIWWGGRSMSKSRRHACTLVGVPPTGIRVVTDRRMQFVHVRGWLGVSRGSRLLIPRLWDPCFAAHALRTLLDVDGCLEFIAKGARISLVLSGTPSWLSDSLHSSYLSIPERSETTKNSHGLQHPRVEDHRDSLPRSIVAASFSFCVPRNSFWILSR